MNDYHVAISSSLETGRQPLADLDINADITDLRWSTTVNGFGDLECGMDAGGPWPVVGYLPEPVNVPLRAHVEVWAGSRIVYEGRVRRRRRGPGGLFTGFTCEGYLAHLSDGWNDSETTASVTSGEALQQIVTMFAPYLRVGTAEQFIDPGVTHSGGLAEWTRMTPGEVVDQIIKEGDSDGNAIDIAVWENRTLWCVPRVTPSTPHYRLPFDESVVTWEDDAGSMASHVTVEYGDGSGGTLTVEAETTGFLSTHGFVRNLLIPAGDITSAAAVALRDRELTTRATPDVSATVSLIDGEMLPLFSGAEQPQALVRALEWVQVGDEPMQIIVGTTHDATARSLTLELGQPSPLLPKNTNLREREAVARMARLINPLSGGRDR